MPAPQSHQSTQSTQPQAFDVRRLSPHIGGEVTGLDLALPLAPETFAALRKAWLEHQVLVFRDQKLTDDDQVRFARYFGTPVGSRSMQQANPHVMLISNIRENGKVIGQLPDGELQFHADSVFLEKPLMGAILHSVEVPASGGNTKFASTYAACDALLARLWELCERPAHIYEHVWRVGDVIMWDNRCTQHARTDFPEGERRLLRRVGIEGDKPY